MDYLKKTFSVPYGTKKYRENWKKIFEFDPLRHCPHASECSHVDGMLCNEECEMIDWTEDEWRQSEGEDGG